MRRRNYRLGMGRAVTWSKEAHYCVLRLRCNRGGHLCLQWFAYRSTHSHCVSCSYLRHFLSFGSRNGTELCSPSLRNGIRPVIWRYGLHWWINDSRFWPHRRLFWTSGRHALCYRNCPFGNHYYPFHPKEQTDEISVSVYRSEILNLRDTANLSP